MAKHDDVIKWKHFPRYWPFVRGIHRSPVNSPHKGQRRGALMFSLICTWINCWVNNGETGDLRRHRAHYDVTVMKRTWIKLMVSQFIPNIVYTLIVFSNIIDFGPSWSTYRKLSENIVKVVLFIRYLANAGLDTNGCPLGNSKFILLSDNLNKCLWLFACQVEKIDQMNNSWSTIY